MKLISFLLFSLLVLCLNGSSRRFLGGGSPFICTDYGDFSDPDSCTTFYQCSVIGGQGTLANCPAGLNWYQAGRYCDWPSNTPCSLPGSTPTAEPSGQTFVCPGVGDYANPADTTTFYTCDNSGVATLNQCAGSLVWNQAQYICDWPSTSNGQTFVCPGVGDYANPADTTSFYTCDNSGVATLNQCAGSLVWNQVQDICDWPFVCPGIGNYANPSDTTTFYTCDSSGVATLNQCSPSLVFNQAEGICDWPLTSSGPSGQTFVCPGVGDYANPADTTTFYTCDNSGAATLNQCAGSLVWNQVQDICDWPSTSSGPSGQTFVCPGVGDYANPADTTTFYTCDNSGVATLNQCADSLVWNQAEDICDWPFVCPGIGNYANPTDTTTFYTCDSSGVATLNQCSASLVFNQAEGICDWPSDPAETSVQTFVCPGVGYYANPADTTTFYICDNSGVATLNQCADSLVWNDAEKICDWPRSSDPPADQTFECPGVGDYANPADTTTFFACDASGVATLNQCSPSLVFNQAEGICDWPSTSSGSSGQTFTCPAVGDYANLADSTTFYICDATGVATLNQCPASLVWNDEEKICDWPPTTSNLGTCRWPLDDIPNPNDCASFIHCSASSVPTEVSWCPNSQNFDTVSYSCGATGVNCPPNQFCSESPSTPYTFNQVAAVTEVDCTTADEGQLSSIPQDTSGMIYAVCTGGLPILYYCCSGYTAILSESSAVCVLIS
jgi:hypothetical protein